MTAGFKSESPAGSVGIRSQAPSLADAADLAVRLAAILRGQSTEAVEDLLRAARSSVLKRFAADLTNAIGLPWSTGPGGKPDQSPEDDQAQHVGRAGFDLLRQRVLNPV